MISGLLGCLTVALALPGAGQARMVYRSPGYTWNHQLPKVAPVAPPAPIALGEGQRPHVLVDAAGTGQIAFNTVGPGTRESVLRDCVLRRGQTGCSSTTSLIPPDDDTGYGNGPQTDVDFDGPYPLQIGNELLMLTTAVATTCRCPTHRASATGSTSSTPPRTGDGRSPGPV